MHSVVIRSFLLLVLCGACCSVRPPTATGFNSAHNPPMLSSSSRSLRFKELTRHRGGFSILGEDDPSSNETLNTTTTSVPTTATTPAPTTNDVVYGNITADYDKGAFGRVQRDLLKAAGVAAAFIILAVLEATLPKTVAKELSRGELMGLEVHLLDDGEDLLATSSKGGSFAGASSSRVSMPDASSSAAGGGGAPPGNTSQQRSSSAAPGSSSAKSLPQLTLPTTATAVATRPPAPQQPPQVQPKRAAADVDDPIRFADEDEDGVELHAML